MAKTKQQKQEILKSLIEKINKSKTIIFTKFNALGVKDNEDLRKKLKAENSEYLAVKKTLLDLAFKDQKIDNLDIKDFNGQIAAVFGYEDETAPARIVDNFKKDVPDKIDFAGGILENKFISAQEVDGLAKLPTKQELYGKIVGSINAPVFGFVNVLAGNLRNLVYVLSAIKNKRNN